ncbi:MAG: hypothetical protein LC808_24570 [Actinobacteria bacterium]|nr:hypothetical protein [Actinomycetota bacterium]
MKKVLGSLIVIVMLAGPLGLPGQAGKSKSTVVGTDVAGDWGDTVDPAIAPAGAALGQDLVEASIGVADAKTLNFVIKVSSLPTGGVPEFTRYTWEMTVDGEAYMLDGKYTDYSRGVCDPPPPLGSGSCPPPRDPGQQPFFVKGDCNIDGASGLASCTEKGIVQGSFDAASGTITIPVPMSLLRAKPGSKILPANLIFGHITAQPAVRGSYTGFPYDRLLVAKVFVVRK